MLTATKINEIASRVAHRQIGDAFAERVVTEDTIDSEGRDALRITVILKPDGVRRLAGGETLDFLVSIQRELSDEGEDRFPIIEYATEQELQSDLETDGDEADEEDA